MTDPAQDLVALTDAVFQADLARLRTITSEEAALRADLATLQGAVSRSVALPASDALALRQLGGDLLWLSWVGRKRSDLNMRIANVMARKLDAEGALRRSFGKAEVAQQIADKAQQKRRADTASKTLEDQQAQAILRASLTATR
ncbi:hypothetical protein U5922_013375 [Aquicoccus sp. G2-2]|uniref:hypothetical protein n=1 Tax=Aquicoccus sp. G2-2 TaxID=3092120 RepID=UPI002AE00C1F|nr:hypothetical protein [Aquicoccus sp. G2-2]MEA1114398.1 hypothetical protein [Aquicoccus sp. G2-2]